MARSVGWDGRLPRKGFEKGGRLVQSSRTKSHGLSEAKSGGNGRKRSKNKVIADSAEEMNILRWREGRSENAVG